MNGHCRALPRISGSNLFHSYMRPVKNTNLKRYLSSRGLIQVHESVQQALHENRPIVALESTIVSHGMPYPQNIELCQTVSKILGEKGVVPATIAVRDGICRVGLDPDELEDLAQAKEHDRVEKCSTREIPLLCSKKTLKTPYWGATTVASTMVLAHKAGIATFVTGGIGGVHRNGQNSLDISADLTELSRTPTVVVSAGIKSILDIQRTLEVLETNGVPTVAFRSDEFPAFFSPHSGVRAPTRVDCASDVARAYWSARELGLPCGMLVGVPNEDPAGSKVEEAIQMALQEAERDDVLGKDVTPFILKRVAELTGGDSLKSNMSLVENNARVGAEIALAISEEQANNTAGQHYFTPKMSSSPPRSKVIVVGGIILDITAKPRQGEIVKATSNPSYCAESDGGVGRNVAETLGRLGSAPVLYSAVGDDSRGVAILDRLSDSKVVFDETTVNTVDDKNTATYLAILDSSGDLNVACADTEILTDIALPTREAVANAEIMVVDGNLNIETLCSVSRLAMEEGTKLFLEPTSYQKAREVAHNDQIMGTISCAFPNVGELYAMAGEEAALDISENLEDVKRVATNVLSRMHPVQSQMVITMGEVGVLLARKGSSIEFQHFQAQEVTVLNATGAGDSLCGAVVHALLKGDTYEQAVALGMRAAELSLKSEKLAVSPELSNVCT